MDLAKFLEVLKPLPLTFLMALAVVGNFLIFGPDAAGLGAFKKLSWLSPATIFVTVLCLLRIIEEILQSYNRVAAKRSQRTLYIIVHSQVNLTWWWGNHEKDNPSTQMTMNVSAYNPSSQPVWIKAVRLIKPNVPFQEIEPIVFTVSNEQSCDFSQLNPVQPGKNASIHLTIIVGRKLAQQGEFLNAKVGLTDQHGYEYKIRVPLWPSP